MGRLFFLLAFSSVAVANPFLPLKSIGEAPAAIQAAAKAIVRIETATIEGTGFFIEKDRFVTNAHVIGAENCTKEGCYFKLGFDFQAGKKATEVEVFGIPLYSDPHHDISLLQIKAPFTADAVLKFAGAAPAIGEELTIVGHPFGGLKRWSTSAAFQKTNDWCTSSHVCPPGSSGSPVLNAKGEIVGIVHRSSDAGNEVLDLKSVRHVAYFSLASAFERLLKKDYASDPSPTLASFTSVPMSGKLEIDPDTAEEIEIPDLEQMLTRKIFKLDIEVEGQKESLALDELLFTLCEEELDEMSEDPDYDYEKCGLAREYIDCKKEGTEGGFCPDEDYRKEWQHLFREVAVYRELKNGSDYLDWLLAVEMDFADSANAARAAGRKILAAEFKRHPEIPKLSMAAYVAEVSSSPEEMVFEGTDYLKVLSNYQKEPTYDPFFEEIGYAIFHLAKSKVLSQSKVQSLYDTLLADPKLPIALKAENEVDAYKLGLLSPP